MRRIPDGTRETEEETYPEYSVLMENVSVSYNGGAPVLKEVNLSLPGGEFIAVLGPNGAGKSTLLQLLMGLLSPLCGRVLLFGQPVHRHRFCNTAAYMPQYQEMDWDFPINVWDVVLGGRYGHMGQSRGFRRFLPPSLSGPQHNALVEKALRFVQMFSHGQRPIRALSGGEKKRVFLARTLVQEARLLLLDEPLAGVDGRSEELILEVLAAEKKEGKTIIMITHDLEAIQSYIDKVVLMDRTVVACGSLEMLKKQRQPSSGNRKNGSLHRGMQ